MAVIFIQGFIIEGLRFMGDYRNILFGLLIIVAMNFRPQGLVDGNFTSDLRKLLRMNQKRGGIDA